jgi:hypothetical protein
MKKSLFIFLFTAVVSLVSSGIYFSLQADEKSGSECPYLKNKSEQTCPYLNEKYGQTDSQECPYLNGEIKPHSSTEDSDSPQCPFLQKKGNSNQNYKTIQNISS